MSRRLGRRRVQHEWNRELFIFQERETVRSAVPGCRGSGGFLRAVTRNWNLAAQVYDRTAQKIIFSTRAYEEKRRDDSIGKS